MGARATATLVQSTITINKYQKKDTVGGKAVSYHNFASLLASCGAPPCQAIVAPPLAIAMALLSFVDPPSRVPVMCVVRSLLKTFWSSCTCATTFVFLIQQRIPTMSLSYENCGLMSSTTDVKSLLPLPFGPTSRPALRAHAFSRAPVAGEEGRRRGVHVRTPAHALGSTPVSSKLSSFFLCSEKASFFSPYGT